MIFGSVLRDDRPLVADSGSTSSIEFFSLASVLYRRKFSGSYCTVPENLGRTRPACLASSYVKSDDRS